MIKTILLLDDDPDERLLLLEALKGMGLDVQLQQFLTLPDLLDHLLTISILPDMLLLDINLPRQTGLEAIRIIKAVDSLAKLDIVMYTNADDELTINQCFELGAGVYMKKTASLETLKKNLQYLLEWNFESLFNLPIQHRTLLN